MGLVKSNYMLEHPESRNPYFGTEQYYGLGNQQGRLEDTFQNPQRLHVGHFRSEDIVSSAIESSSVADATASFATLRQRPLNSTVALYV